MVVRHIIAVNAIINLWGEKMFVKVGEYVKEKINYLRLVDTYACKVIDIPVISRRKYNIINEYLDMSAITSGVMVIGLNSAARVLVDSVDEATYCVLFYIETGKFEVVEREKLSEMSEFLNIVYDAEQYAKDSTAAVETEHKRIEQMFASFLPQCTGSVSQASLLRRLDRAFISTGYWTLAFGGRSYTLCPDGEGILRIAWLEDIKKTGISPFIIVKGTEELTLDKQTVSNNIVDMSGIDMSDTKRLYLPDYVTRAENVGSEAADLHIGVRGFLYNTRTHENVGIDDLWGTVSCQ